MSMFRDFGSAAKGNNAPVTVGIVVLMVVGFVANWMMHGGLTKSLAFIPVLAPQEPWTFLTYPFGVVDVWTALFVPLWMWGIGATVERELGSVKFLVVWLIFTFLSAGFFWLGDMMLHPLGLVVLAGGWVPVVSLTVMWATRNPNTSTLFMFVIPLAAKWLAWICVALVFFTTVPELAPFAAIPFILAWAYSSNRLPFATYSRGASIGGAAKKWERYDKSYFDDVKRRENERDERERLRKLFEGSVSDEGEDRESGN